MSVRTKLVRCLQANAEQYSVGIEHDSEAIMIVDLLAGRGDALELTL